MVHQFTQGAEYKESIGSRSLSPYMCHVHVIDLEEPQAPPLIQAYLHFQEKQFGVLTVLRRKKKMSDWTESQKNIPCASNYQSISGNLCYHCFSIPKDGFEVLRLQEFHHQHIQNLQTQDVDNYGQTLQYSPLLVLADPQPRWSSSVPRL